jgi:glycosyltransferase involved in cell wall biosynthesis
MKKPKILCISALPPPYHGVSVANDILLNNDLIRSKYDLIIIPLHKSKLQSGGGLSLATLLADLEVTAKVSRAIISHKPQLIYFCLSQTQLGLLREACWVWPGTLGKAKFLVHMHGGYFRHMFENLSLGMQMFLKLMLSRIHGFIVLDNSLRHLFQGLVPDERIFALRNGIPDDLTEENFAGILQARRRQKRLRVTFLSNLVQGKGFDTFLEAAAEIKQKNRAADFIFNLAGAPPDAAVARQVEDFIQSRGLGAFVRVLGKVFGPEKWRTLLESDVFVFPTRYPPEGQPFAIIEALAAGLPVISTARGSIPAMVQESSNGFIVPEGDAIQIAERLSLLKDNVPLRLSMSKASRELFKRDYTAKKFIHEFLAIVDHVMEAA